MPTDTATAILPQPPPAAATLPTLAEWTPLSALHERYPEKFTSKHAVLWAARIYRADLVAAGALCMIAGRMHVHPARFEVGVIAGGMRLAAKRAA